MALLQDIDGRSKQDLGVKQPRIFVTNWAGHDFSPALSWTTLAADEAFVAITNGDVDMFNFDRLIYRIREKLTDFQSFDYLLLSGHPFPFSFALHILINNFMEIKTLVWDRKQRRYHLRYVTQASFKFPLDPNNGWSQPAEIEEESK